MNIFTVDWVNSVPKIIDSNGCWIPIDYNHWYSKYIRITINYKMYMLHRISMCAYYRVDYNDHTIETRHSTNCSTHCFNPEHLKPGTSSDNQKDSIRDGTNFNSNKTHCTKCGASYRTKTIKSGMYKGKVCRYCPRCKVKQRSAEISRRRKAKRDLHNSRKLSGG